MLKKFVNRILFSISAFLFALGLSAPDVCISAGGEEDFPAAVLSYCEYDTGNCEPDNGLEVVVTAYDLSSECCEKESSHQEYGITATGTSLIGKSRETAATIAVDPDIIPLGSLVEISFADEAVAERYNGIYTAADTGGAIEGHHIDLYMGEDNYLEAIKFGRQEAVIKILG